MLTTQVEVGAEGGALQQILSIGYSIDRCQPCTVSGTWHLQPLVTEEASVGSSFWAYTCCVSGLESASRMGSEVTKRGLDPELLHQE